MINSESLAAVAASRFSERWGMPIYAGYGFAQIPPTIMRLLTGTGGPGLPAGALAGFDQRYDTVILILLDSFGWRFFERNQARYPFLQRIVEQGVVSKLTTQFPSTTAAHVTTMHTGLPVGRSGVFEWYYYEPLLDAMIAPLLCSFAGDKQRDTLLAAGVDPAALYPNATFYHALASQGVRSLVFQHEQYARSPYSNVVTAGAQIIPYRTLSDGLVSLAQSLGTQRGRGYYCFYFESIDSVCHLRGPDSPHAEAEIDTTLTALERVLHPLLAAHGKRTLLLLTADHGHMPINPATTIYLNHLLPDLPRLLRTTRAGRPLAPGGSSRDQFMYVRDEHLDEAEGLLRTALEGRADVYRVEDLIAQGLFGPEISPEFRSRVGNLVLLPYAGESLWWHEPGRFEQRYYGNHGGLSALELETLLLAIEYN